ncbi:hypothetical protein ACFE04_014743 [Oxalis oulophora]
MLRKSKRISWAPDVNLCQSCSVHQYALGTGFSNNARCGTSFCIAWFVWETRLFLVDESPSQVGLGTQDDLQAMLSHSTRASADDNLPPGFEVAPSANQNQMQVLEISQIRWRSPPKFELNPDWEVVAGGESLEMEVENQRDLRVLEAVYPRLSAIPPNPVFPTDSEGFYDDNQTPLISMNPIEDEDAPADSLNVPISSQPPPPLASNPNMSSNFDPDIARAAYAAVASITKSNEHGNLIDNELLVKILSDPKLIGKLLVDGSVQNAQNVSLSSPAVPIQNPPSMFHVNSAPSLAATSSGQYYPSMQNGTGVGHRVSPSSSSAGVSQAKDVNYYKNLIQQHGGERQQQPAPQQQYGNRFNQDNITPPQQFGNRFNPEPNNNPRPRDSSKPKIIKPCMYFNTSKGCRNGTTCPFQHDASTQQHQQQRGSSNGMPEGPAAKRMKMDREISS